MGKNLFIIILLVFFSSSIFAQTVNPEMLKKAKMLGISEEQINAEIAKSQSPLTPEVTNKASYNPRVSDTTNVTRDFLDKQYEEQLKEQLSKDLSAEKDSLAAYSIFGQDLFANNKITYEPNLNIPTPANYTLSVGDEVIINVWGDSEFTVKEAISPDGLVYIPNLGPVHISGMTASNATNYIKAQLSKIIESIGTTTQLILSIGQIRSIKVNVAGEVSTPGTYTVPSLATLFHMMHICGGTTKIGDLRNIEVYRDSKKVADMDIYNFIMNGDISNNIILKDGDVVIVPPYSSKTYIAGEIKRPMYYLMKDNESIGSLIKYAGEFTQNAYKSRVKVFRKSGEYNEVLSVEKDDFNTLLINNGDSVVVEKAKNEFENLLVIQGAIWYPGDFQLNEKTNTLSKLIKYAGGLKGNAFAKSAIIERREADYTKSHINFSPIDIVSGKTDIELRNYDNILIPILDSLREDFTVTILGEVNKPDTLIYMNDMRIEDVIILAGGLKESASLSVIDVSRRIRDRKSIEYTDQKSELFSFQINEDLSLTPETEAFVLQPYDIVAVRRSPRYKEQTTITINGEVIMPGNYTVEHEGTYLSDVLEISKGATPFAYFKGANLVRLQLESNSTIELAITKLTESMADRDSLSVNLEDLKHYPVAIDFEKALANPGGVDDILLQAGDIITIPKLENIVNTIGGVYYPNASRFLGSKLKDYISSSGGYTRTARKRPFVVYKNGTVKATKNYVFWKVYPKIEPGCLVVIPLKPANSVMSISDIAGIASSGAALASSLAVLGINLRYVAD